MFSTLETNWDQSARRGWTTFASFTMQALGVSLLLLIPLLTIQGPPRLQWFETPMLTPPPPPAPPPPGPRPHASNIGNGQLLQPPTIPTSIANLHESHVASAPDLGEVGVEGGTAVRTDVESSAPSASRLILLHLRLLQYPRTRSGSRTGQKAT